LSVCCVCLAVEPVVEPCSQLLITIDTSVEAGTCGWCSGEGCITGCRWWGARCWVRPTIVSEVGGGVVLDGAGECFEQGIIVRPPARVFDYHRVTNVPYICCVVLFDESLHVSSQLLAIAHASPRFCAAFIARLRARWSLFIMSGIIFCLRLSCACSIRRSISASCSGMVPAWS